MNDLSLAFDQLYQFDNQMSSGQAYFIVSHFNDVDGNYYSHKISLENLAMQLNSLYSRQFKSAAYCESSDFASKNHDHDIYTSAAFYPATMQSEHKKTVMKMKTSKTTYEMSLSSVQSSEPVDVGYFIENTKLKLGTLRFIAINDLTSYNSQLDFSNASFSGWVRADGKSTYKINDFMLSNDIAKVFNVSGQTFTVPALTSFFKINDEMNSNSYTMQNGHLGLQSHMHSINASGSQLIVNSTDINANNDQLAKISENKRFSQASTPEYIISNDKDSGLKLSPKNAHDDARNSQTGIHDGQNNNKNFSLDLRGNTSFKNYMLNGIGMMNEDGVDNEIPYPSHNMIPAVVYVGPSKYTDLQRFVFVVQ